MTHEVYLLGIVSCVERDGFWTRDFVHLCTSMHHDSYHHLQIGGPFFRCSRADSIAFVCTRRATVVAVVFCFSLAIDLFQVGRIGILMTPFSVQYDNATMCTVR
jgi:hypothetical protein